MDRKQKLEQQGFKNNVTSIRNKDIKIFTAEEALQEHPVDSHKAMFETLGDNLSPNIKGGKNYWHQQYLDLRAMAEK